MQNDQHYPDTDPFSTEGAEPKKAAPQKAHPAPTPSPSPNTRGGELPSPSIGGGAVSSLPSPSIGGGAGGGGRPHASFRSIWAGMSALFFSLLSLMKPYISIITNYTRSLTSAGSSTYVFLLFLLFFFGVSFASTTNQQGPEEEILSVAMTSTATASVTESATPSATASATASATPTKTPPPTYGIATKVTPTASHTLVPNTATKIVRTATPSATASATFSPTATATRSPTATATRSPTATAKRSPSPTAMRSPTKNAKHSLTEAYERSTPVKARFSPTATATLSLTEAYERSTPVKARFSPTATATLSLTATATLSPTATATLSPSATATLLPSSTATLLPSATATLLPSATATLLPSATATLLPTATATLLPTATATLLPTATATLLPTASNRFVTNQVVGEADCSRTVVYGVIRGDEVSLNGVQVRVWSPEAENSEFFIQASGEIPHLGPGGYEVVLDDKPKAGAWLVAVVDESGTPVSEAQEIQTTEQGCDDGSGQQAIQINFLRRKGKLGTEVALLSPIPATFVPASTPTPIPAVKPYSIPDGIWRTVNVPILMYHYVSVPPPDSDIYRIDLSVEPELFRAQLIALREQNYTSITLSDLYYAIEGGKPLPEKPIVLTFDDGYLDNYTHAFPIMKQEGFVGTFFLITNLPEEWNVDYMNWPQIQEMAAAGMEFGSHTKSHADLPNIGYEQLLEELSGSRAILEQQLGQEIITFSYPFGRFNDDVAYETYQAGYLIAVTTKQGATHDNGNIRTLRRVRVSGGTSPARLINIIDYWLPAPEPQP